MKRVSRDPCRCYKDQFFGVNFSGIHNINPPPPKKKKNNIRKLATNKNTIVGVSGYVLNLE